jgi:hypothetical protein
MSAALKRARLLPAILLLAAPAVVTSQVEEQLPFEVLEYSLNGPREDLQAIVFKRKEWKRLWRWAHSNLAVVPPRPEVDFSKRMIVVVSYEYLPDPSWSAAVTKVAKTDDSLQISVRETLRQGEFCPPVPAVLVHPLLIIEAERVDKRLIRHAQFEVERETVDCEPHQ